MNNAVNTTTNRQQHIKTNKFEHPDSLGSSEAIVNHSTADLITKLCNLLDEERIDYCHWKSNNALNRSASGDNDLDLLVNRADISIFSEILHRLGFKQAYPTKEKQMIGVQDYYGYDDETNKLIHVHAHFQLIIGHDKTKNFRLPIEVPYLDSSIYCKPFRIPAPEFEFVVFVIRMNLKYSTWDVILQGDGKLKTSEREEFDYLNSRINKERIHTILKIHLPYIDVKLFENCISVLEPGSSLWQRIKTGQKLQKTLCINARRSLTIDIALKFIRRFTRALRRRLSRIPFKQNLSNGGAFIAIVGGDGAGKTTAVNEIYKWLSKDFNTHKVHIGKPPRSLSTNIVRALLKPGHLLGLYPHLNANNLYTEDTQTPKFSGKYPWMFREVCKARDRYQTYLKAKRFANNGGIVICDRYPLPQIKLMDGPSCSQITKGGKVNWLAKRLIEIEESYYRPIKSPDLIFVLTVNPEITVKRKTDEDQFDVRVRSTEIWEIDWKDSGVTEIDAHLSQVEVLRSLQSTIWANL